MLEQLGIAAERAIDETDGTKGRQPNGSTGGWRDVVLRHTFGWQWDPAQTRQRRAMDLQRRAQRDQAGGDRASLDRRGEGYRRSYYERSRPDRADRCGARRHVGWPAGGRTTYALPGYRYGFDISLNIVTRAASIEPGVAAIRGQLVTVPDRTTLSESAVRWIGPRVPLSTTSTSTCRASSSSTRCRRFGAAASSATGARRRGAWRSGSCSSSRSTGPVRELRPAPAPAGARGGRHRRRRFRLPV